MPDIISSIGKLDGIPVLSGYVEATNVKTLKVWCPYCATFHLHGFDGNFDSLKNVLHCHKVAHCIIDNSPFDKTGYLVNYCGALTGKVKKLYKQRKPYYCLDCGQCVPYLLELRKETHNCKQKGANRKYKAKCKLAGVIPYVKGRR